ncbi:Pvc16 family protein [Actinokineospora enzanensis]|uniref:Pvc16 family protein n=1 Tax=Actinokineospora enzanensis TaxID=155975 RepID=UPI0003730BDA|nr:Pvc16 family protein [Actinokineospora enzanensis]
MITEVDDALCVLLRRGLPEGTVVRLDPPKPTWQTEHPTQAVDLFLFGLHDDPRGRESGWSETRDERGAVVARRSPSRRCVLSYLVAARAPEIDEEHLLLDRALRTVMFTETVPVECVEEPVFLTVADTDPGTLWSSLGMPARAAFVMTVSAALVPDPDAELAPPAEKLTLRSGKPPAPVKRWTRT